VVRVSQPLSRRKPAGGEASVAVVALVVQAGPTRGKAAQDLGVLAAVRADRLTALLRVKAPLSIAESVRHR
jgi:hypothetical protein